MALKYKIFISQSAEKALKKIPEKDQQRIAALIWSLGVNPLPQGVKKLAGFSNIFRVRSGAYRVIYEMDKRNIIITVIKIGHRKEVYR